MKTAEEILHSKFMNGDDDMSHHEKYIAEEAIKEFARQAVEVAIEDITENAKCIVMQAQDDSVMAIVSHDSILNRKEQIFKKLGI